MSTEKYINVGRNKTFPLPAHQPNIMPPRIILFTLLFTLLTTACTQTAEDPKSIADKYWQFLQAGNTAEAEKLVSTNSRHALAEHKNRIASINQLDNSETKTIVNTTITTINPKTSYSHTESFHTVLVLQQGQWKVDINQSQIPPPQSANEQELQHMAEELSESMQENIDSIDDAMHQGMQLLNDALRDGSKEMGDSLLHLMNELNSTMHKSIDKMKERREQEAKEKPEQNQPDPKMGEGMI